MSRRTVMWARAVRQAGHASKVLPVRACDKYRGNTRPMSRQKYERIIKQLEKKGIIHTDGRLKGDAK